RVERAYALPPQAYWLLPAWGLFSFPGFVFSFFGLGGKLERRRPPVVGGGGLGGGSGGPLTLMGGPVLLAPCLHRLGRGCRRALSDAPRNPVVLVPDVARPARRAR